MFASLANEHTFSPAINSWDPLENYPKEQMNLLATLVRQVHGNSTKFLPLAPSI